MRKGRKGRNVQFLPVYSVLLCRKRHEIVLCVLCENFASLRLKKSKLNRKVHKGQLPRHLHSPDSNEFSEFSENSFNKNCS